MKNHLPIFVRIVFIFFGLHISLNSNSQVVKEIQKVTASDREANENYGSSVDISGDFAIVGVAEEGTKTSSGKSGEGAAYIYQKQSDGSWKEIQKLVSNKRGKNDAFGRSVAISGNFAYVGATGHEYDEAGENYVRWAGAVYVFERNSNGQWIEIQKLVAPKRSTASFGSSISIDGNTMVIGAPDEKTGGANQTPVLMSGSIYVFKKDVSGKWEFEQNIIASDRKSNTYFGHNLSVQGNMIAVGAHWETSDALNQNPLRCAGAVYIYKKNENGDWLEVQKIVSSDRDSIDFFGWDVEMKGKTLVVGAYRQFIGKEPIHGAVYTFRLQDDGTWVETQKLRASDHGQQDSFGYSVALSGNLLLVGACGDYDDVNGKNRLLESGSAYLFVQGECGKWNQIQKFTPKIRGYSAGFGIYMAIDKNMAIISAPGEETDAVQKNKINDGGAVYIFEIIGANNSSCNDPIVTEVISEPINVPENFNLDVSLSVNNCQIVLTSNDEKGTYQWGTCENGFVKIEGENKKTFYPTKNGLYGVMITKGDSSLLSDCYPIKISDTQNVSDNGSNNFSINPARNSGVFQIEVSGTIKEKFRVDIVNSFGKSIQQLIITEASTKVDLGKVKKGLYVVKINTSNGVKRIPVIIE